MQPTPAGLAAEAELSTAANELEAEHDSAYRTARQQYLRQLLADPQQPRHVRGWIQQELNRLAAAQRAEQAGLRGPGGSARNLRGIPGMDVGHKLGKHDQHHPQNFRLEDARFNRARPGLSRRLGLFHKYRESEASLEHELESAATELAGEIGGPERMDPWQATAPIREWWRALPPDVKAQIVAQARLFYQMGGAYLGPFLTALARVFAQNPAGWQQAIETNRAAATQQLAVQAGRAAQLPARGASPQPGMTDTQVRDYHRRQLARGRVPGRNRHTGRQRELELELEQASRELAGPESFYTKVTPIPGIGNKEGHEVLTRAAMRGFTLTPAEQASVLLGVIRPDRGGQSYWNFPLAALGSLTAAAQPAHALRPTPAASVPAALGFIRARFALLHSQAMRAPTRATALEWLGEALHLLQDSFSSAHVERDPATGRIRYIRAFYVTASWPPFSQAPREHNAPSDTRDDVYLGGTLRPEARAVIWASQKFLLMALRHLSSPLAPSNAAELNAFMNQFLSM